MGERVVLILFLILPVILPVLVLPFLVICGGGATLSAFPGGFRLGDHDVLFLLIVLVLLFLLEFRFGFRFRIASSPSLLPLRFLIRNNRGRILASLLPLGRRGLGFWIRFGVGVGFIVQIVFLVLLLGILRQIGILPFLIVIVLVIHGGERILLTLLLPRWFGDVPWSLACGLLGLPSLLSLPAGSGDDALVLSTDEERHDPDGGDESVHVRMWRDGERPLQVGNHEQRSRFHMPWVGDGLENGW